MRRADVRHKRCADGLEQYCQASGEASQIRAQSCAEREDAEEEGHNGKEECDDVERPSNAAQIVVFTGANELTRQASRCTEVLRGRKRQRGSGVPAVRVEAILDAADGEVSPAGWVLVVTVAVGDARGVGLEEEDLVDGRADVRAGEYDEELHDDAAGQQEYGHKAEDGSCEDMLDGVWETWCLSW